jgi:hypothetical protein
MGRHVSGEGSDHHNQSEMSQKHIPISLLVTFVERWMRGAWALRTAYNKPSPSHSYDRLALCPLTDSYRPSDSPILFPSFFTWFLRRQPLVHQYSFIHTLRPIH